MPFKTAPALECFLSNISSTVCFPICRALLRLVPGRALPVLQRECRLRSSAFLNQIDNLSLRCFSRKSKNYSFSSQTGAFIVTYVTSCGRWSGAFKSWSQPVIYSDLPLAHIVCPAVPFNTAQALECFLPPNILSTLCFPICRVLLRLAPGSTLPALQRECKLRSSAFLNQADNLSLRCFSRKSKNYSFSRQVCLHCYIMVGGDRWCAFKSRSQPVNYSDLPLARILCPAVPFKTAPALKCFLSNISSTVCFPICRALLRLVPGRALPVLQRECRLRSSAFLNQTDNLSLRCFSRKSKNYSFSRPVPSLLRHGGRWSGVFKFGSHTVIYSDLPLADKLCPAVPFKTAPALQCFLPNTSTWCFLICRASLRLVPGRALIALQRERQLRSSAFPNQTDNLSLRCFSRKSKNSSFSSPTGAFIVVGGDRWCACKCPQMPSCAFGTLHQHLSAFCQIFPAQDASLSTEPR